MKLSLNLYRAELRPRPERLGLPTALMVWLLVMTLLVVAGLPDQRQAVRQRLANAALEQRQTRQQAQIAELEQAVLQQGDEASLRAALADLEQRLGAEQALLGLLRAGALSTSSPSAYLRAAAAARVDGLWLEALILTGSGAALELAGRCLSPERLPEYLQALSQQPAFTGYRFAQYQLERPMRALLSANASPDTPPRDPFLPWWDFRLQAPEVGPDALTEGGG